MGPNVLFSFKRQWNLTHSNTRGRKVRWCVEAGTNNFVSRKSARDNMALRRKYHYKSLSEFFSFSIFVEMQIWAIKQCNNDAHANPIVGDKVTK